MNFAFIVLFSSFCQIIILSLIVAIRNSVHDVEAFFAFVEILYEIRVMPRKLQFRVFKALLMNQTKKPRWCSAWASPVFRMKL